METMPELQEIKSEIGGVDFGGHGGSASTTPQPHQNFQWVSDNHGLSPVVVEKKELTDCPIVWSRQMVMIRNPWRWLEGMTRTLRSLFCSPLQGEMLTEKVICL